WVAVIYADWRTARAPHPDLVLEVALSSDDCDGILIDTFDKSPPSPVDLSCRKWIERARNAGRLVALGGGIDLDAIARLGPLKPDIFAVRGAACYDGNRHNDVDPSRVAQLARAAALS
ncbi:MAG: (5-formylfuran-3-yl)methyl phosphate synthase, partial [Isosphaeraceae bacterium]